MRTSTAASSISVRSRSAVSGARTAGLPRAPSAPTNAGTAWPRASRTRPCRGSPRSSRWPPRTRTPTTGGRTTSISSRPRAAATARTAGVTGDPAGTRTWPAVETTPWRRMPSPRSGRTRSSGTPVRGSSIVTSVRPSDRCRAELCARATTASVCRGTGMRAASGDAHPGVSTSRSSTSQGPSPQTANPSWRAASAGGSSCTVTRSRARTLPAASSSRAAVPGSGRAALRATCRACGHGSTPSRP